MSKKSKIIVSIVVSVLVIALIGLVFIFYNSRNSNKPENTIHKFTTALNNDNINGMLEYIEPTEAQLIQSGISKLERITNTSLDKLIDILPFVTYISDTDLFPEYDIEIVSSNIQEDNTAIVRIVATSKDSNISTTLDVYMINIEDTWYIQYATIV